MIRFFNFGRGGKDVVHRFRNGTSSVRQRKIDNKSNFFLNVSCRKVANLMFALRYFDISVFLETV